MGQFAAPVDCGSAHLLRATFGVYFVGERSAGIAIGPGGVGRLNDAILSYLETVERGTRRMRKRFSLAIRTLPANSAISWRLGRTWNG
jgi:hypothetical protein